MTTIKIDNVEYDHDTLSDEAKAQLAIAQTARIAYASALKSALPAIGGSDTIKLA